MFADDLRACADQCADQHGAEDIFWPNWAEDSRVQAAARAILGARTPHGEGGSCCSGRDVAELLRYVADMLES